MHKQRIQQLQKQKLSLTPQQVQQIRMFELTTLELEERVTQELEENPALEEGVDPMQEELFDGTDDFHEGENEDIAAGEYRSDEEIPDSQGELRTAVRVNEFEFDNSNRSESETLQEHLLHQIRLREMSEADLAIAEYLIGNIDEEGYLRTHLATLSDELLFKLNLDIAATQLSEVLEQIQDLEPAGVGANSLQECLLLQLERRRGLPSNRIAYEILDLHFEDFVQRRFDKIKQRLSIDDSTLKQVIEEIQSLTPKPGAAWNSDIYQERSTIITPDFFVTEELGELLLSMNNENLPELTVSRHYANLLEAYHGNKANRTRERREEIQYLNEKINSARGFIEMLKVRHNTLSQTMATIIDLQRTFFLTGEETTLRPMTLQNVADRCGFDISTISRVSNSKYVQTQYGTFPLKHFFSDAIQNEEGEEISNREVKAILRDLIAAEEKQKPLTDDKLCTLLHSKGYIIARRTVAKYREQLGIPVARQRKEL